MSEVEQNNQKDNGNNYQKMIEKLNIFLSVGNESLDNKAEKLKANQIGGLVEELFKEERQETYNKTKQDLKNLLKTHVEMKVEIAKKEQELKKLVAEKEKDFVKKANELFSKIEGIDSLFKDYAESLKEAVDSTKKEE